MNSNFRETFSKCGKKSGLLKIVTGMAVFSSLLLVSCSAKVQDGRSLKPIHSVEEQAFDDSLIDTVKQIEEHLDARVGLFVQDKETGLSWQYKADERFPMSSTFKTLACASLLSQVDDNQERLERVITFGEEDLVTYSPITETRTGDEGMSLAELCHAAMSMSDNSAANFILEAIGGPEGLTQFLRSIGDDVTRLDRWETELNEGIPGDERDTTTPRAMAATLERLVFGDELSSESRQQLQVWLEENAVADDLFRAVIPEDWKIGDRTGAGGYGSRSITAVIWPLDRSPVIATVYITETEASLDERNAAIAEIGSAITETILQSEQ